jgi:hypothetical protein
MPNRLGNADQERKSSSVTLTSSSFITRKQLRGDFIVYPGEAESICRFPCASNILLVKLVPEFMYE